MSSPDASIDPILRSLACSPSTYSSVSTPAVTATSQSISALNYKCSHLYSKNQSLQDSPGTDSENFQDDCGSSDPKRPRACEACRGLKVRCETDLSNPEGKCKRCAKANRECIVTAPSRKKRKKTDSRVAELEKKINALTATLFAQGSGGTSLAKGIENDDIYASQLNAASEAQLNNSQKIAIEGYDNNFINQSKIHAGQKSRNTVTYSEPQVLVTDFQAKCTDGGGTWTDLSPQPRASKEYTDVIDRGLIPEESASRMFDEYVEKMAPYMPIVVFATGTTYPVIRKSKPVLFLAILSASSGISHPHLGPLLADELMRIYADRIIYSGYKTLELVQALQISTIWYFPPDRFEDFNLFQLVHIAAVMAIDIGMGRKYNPFRPRASSTYGNYRTICPDPESIESRRAWLGCYWLCCHTSMTLRHPNLIRWSSFIADSVDILEKSHEALASDKVLCQWVKVQNIAEEIGTQFSMGDPEALISISDPQVQFSLKAFERDLEKRKSNSKLLAVNPLLEINEHFVNLYMHEIAMHVNHNVDSFKPMFNDDALQSLTETCDQTPLSSVRVHALSVCLTSIDGILENFLGLEIESIRALPTATFCRVAYSIIMLLKMYITASTQNSELGKVIGKDNMKVRQYMDRLIEKLRVASADIKSRPSANFMLSLCRIKSKVESKLEDNLAEHATNSSIKSSSREVLMEYPKDSILRTVPHLLHKVQHEYSPANTPLQLLSEVATSNSRDRLATDSVNTYSSPGIEWQQSTQISFPRTLPPSQIVGGQANSNNGNLDPFQGTELDYLCGNELEQATNLAFGLGDFGTYPDKDALLGSLINSVIPTGMTTYEGVQ